MYLTSMRGFEPLHGGAAIAQKRGIREYFCSLVPPRSVHFMIAEDDKLVQVRQRAQPNVEVNRVRLAAKAGEIATVD